MADIDFNVLSFLSALGVPQGTAVKCACGKAGCLLQIVIDRTVPGLWFTDPRGSSWLMKLDANATVELIRGLKDLLLTMTEVE